ncbi:hypothetical protein GCM10009641_47020 [Mycobacterium cookii]|uniref:HD domain-containing protein n=1 Tax=Nocardioides furvisabuli TaxID=375542 RepID=A0ABN2XPY1_9ACTN|nr:hypothetical protein [Nocardioides furvisabuli]
MYGLTEDCKYDTMMESQNGWPDLIVPGPMWLTALAAAFPHEAFKTSHTWGVQGWESVVRYCVSDEGEEMAALAVVLHDAVVCWKPFDSIEEAVGAVQHAHMFAAHAVSRTFAAYVDSMTCPDRVEDKDWQEGFRTARWRFQALTGMHIGFMNALCELMVSYTQLMFLCRARPVLRDAFVQALVVPEAFDMDQPDWMWQAGFWAEAATREERSRLYGTRRRVDLTDPGLHREASLW